MTPVPGSCFPLVFLSPSLSGQMPDAVTVVSPACLAVSLVFPACPPCVSQSLRSDARCCDAVSRSLCNAVTLAPGSSLPLVSAPGLSPACLSPSLCGQMRDALSPCVSQSRLPVWLRGRPLVSLCLEARCCVSQSLRCCDAGSRVVSRLSSCVSHSRGQMPDAVTPAPGSCLHLSPCVSQSHLPVFSQFLRLDAGCCDAGSGVLPSFQADLACLASSDRRSAPFGSRGSSAQAQLRSIKSSPARNIDSKSEGTTCSGEGHVADFAVSLCAKDVPLSWPSAGLHPCGASLELEASNVEL